MKKIQEWINSNRLMSVIFATWFGLSNLLYFSRDMYCGIAIPAWELYWDLLTMGYINLYKTEISVTSGGDPRFLNISSSCDISYSPFGLVSFVFIPIAVVWIAAISIKWINFGKKLQ